MGKCCLKQQHPPIPAGAAPQTLDPRVVVVCKDHLDIKPRRQTSAPLCRQVLVRMLGTYPCFQPWLPAFPSSAAAGYEPAGEGGGSIISSDNLPLFFFFFPRPSPQLLEAAHWCWGRSHSHGTGAKGTHCCPACTIDAQGGASPNSHPFPCDLAAVPTTAGSSGAVPYGPHP